VINRTNINVMTSTSDIDIITHKHEKYQLLLSIRINPVSACA
jgi:hypothetical protein